MRSTGIVRKIDSLGRVVLPKELRDNLDIAQNTPVEIFVDGNTIILEKDSAQCSICCKRYTNGELTTYKKGHICPSCLRELRSL